MRSKLWKPPRSAAQLSRQIPPYPSPIASPLTNRATTLASRRRRQRRIIIMDTAANIASLSAMTLTKNRAWPEQYEVTPIHVRRTCTAYVYAVHVRRRTCTCTTYMCDSVNINHTCTAYMYALHVRRTCMIV